MAKPVTRSAPIRAAWRKGLSAGMRGLPDTVNPYKESPDQQVSDIHGWSRLYATQWLVGWTDGRELAEERERLANE